MVDPNCRPAIARGDYRARLERVLALADVVKVSEEDLAWLAPGVPAVEAARALLDRGPAVVLLTLGGDGAVAIGRELRGRGARARRRGRRHDRRRRRVLRRLAGLLGRARAGPGRARRFRSAVVAATRFACHVAALTCARAGASPPRRAELEQAV